MQRSRGLHAPAGGFEEDEDWEREVCTVCWQGERGVLVGRERCAVRSPAARDCSLGWPFSGSQHCQMHAHSPFLSGCVRQTWRYAYGRAEVFCCRGRETSRNARYCSSD